MGSPPFLTFQEFGTLQGHAGAAQTEYVAKSAILSGAMQGGCGVPAALSHFARNLGLEDPRRLLGGGFFGSLLPLLTERVNLGKVPLTDAVHCRVQEIEKTLPSVWLSTDVATRVGVAKQMNYAKGSKRGLLKFDDEVKFSTAYRQTSGIPIGNPALSLQRLHSAPRPSSPSAFDMMAHVMEVGRAADAVLRSDPTAPTVYLGRTGAADNLTRVHHQLVRDPNTQLWVPANAQTSAPLVFWSQQPGGITHFDSGLLGLGPLEFKYSLELWAGIIFGDCHAVGTSCNVSPCGVRDPTLWHGPGVDGCVMASRAALHSLGGAAAAALVPAVGADFEHHILNAGVGAVVAWHAAQIPPPDYAVINAQALAACVAGHFGGVGGGPAGAGGAAAAAAVAPPPLVVLSALAALYLYSGSNPSISPIPCPLLRTGLLQAAAFKMQADFVGALTPVARRKLQCTQAAAQQLLEVIATPVPLAKANAAGVALANGAVGTYTSRGGAPGEGPLTTGPGSLEGNGVLQLTAWAPTATVGSGIATGGPKPQLNTTYASHVTFHTAAAGAPPVPLTKALFAPGGDLSSVTQALGSGIMTKDLCPANNGGGKASACGIPPSEEQLAAYAEQTMHTLVTPAVADAVHFVVPRGEWANDTVREYLKDGTFVGSNEDVWVDAVDVTAVLAGTLSCVSSGCPEAYEVHRTLVILTHPSGQRSIFLLVLDHYHPGYVHGQLSMGAAMLRLSPVDFVQLWRLQLWRDLCATPRAISLGLGTTTEALQWEMGLVVGLKSYQAVLKDTLNSRGGALATAAKVHKDSIGLSQAAAERDNVVAHRLLLKQQAAAGGEGKKARVHYSSTTTTTTTTTSTHSPSASMQQDEEGGAGGAILSLEMQLFLRRQQSALERQKEQERREYSLEGLLNGHIITWDSSLHADLPFPSAAMSRKRREVLEGGGEGVSGSGSSSSSFSAGLAGSSARTMTGGGGPAKGGGGGGGGMGGKKPPPIKNSFPAHLHNALNTLQRSEAADASNAFQALYHLTSLSISLSDLENLNKTLAPHKVFYKDNSPSSSSSSSSRSSSSSSGGGGGGSITSLAMDREGGKGPTSANIDAVKKVLKVHLGDYVASGLSVRGLGYGPHITIPACSYCGGERVIQIGGRLKPVSKQISVEHSPCKGGGKDGKCKGSTITHTEKEGGAVFHHVSFLHFQHLLTFQRDAIDEALVYPEELLNYMAFEGVGKVKKPRVEVDVFDFFKERVEHHKSAYMKLDLWTHDTLTTRATTLV